MKTKDAAPLLVSKLNDPKDLVRSAIVDALGTLGDRTVISDIRKLRNDASPVVRERVISSLVVLGAANDEDFQEALKDPDSRVRETATLIYSGKGQGVNFVKTSLDSSPHARAESAIQLGRNWDKKGETRLKELMSDPDEEVQLFAAIALWTNNQDSGGRLLRHTLETITDSDELLEVASAFARIGKEKSLKSLERIFYSDWEPTARSSAAIMFMGIAEDPSLKTIRVWQAKEKNPAVKKTLNDIVDGKIQ